MALTVGLTYNAKENAPKVKGAPDDVYAELDDMETVSAVKHALESRGHRVVLIEADLDAYEKLKTLRPDIVFNIAEGFGGECRESQIPAMLEMLSIPYTASGPFTLAVCLNKARTKEILAYHGIPTPKFQVFHSPDEKFNHRLRFPLIVKPLQEGSSMGIRDDSVVRNTRELKDKVRRVVRLYREPVLVEEYLEGGEFTVAVMGNEKLVVLPIVELTLRGLPEKANRIYSYEAKWLWDNSNKPVEGIFECPAKISGRLKKSIEKVALDAYRVLECRDWCRIDLRLDERGIPNVLELNPLPGILPKPEDHSWFPAAARAAGMTYDEMINKTLEYALKRCKIKA